ncbi:ATP-binding cassette domain-containing protein [Flavobacteriaceae bacterium R38]|nr:ATP-binding cassette domain-containing protein [Flavobacteriaceae bacterium R38]
MENVLDIQNLNKDYGGFKLDNISVSLPPGHIMGLVGPNGSGKTSLIKIILNLILKDTGDIKVFGLDQQKYILEIKQRIAFIHDDHKYFNHLNLKQVKNIIAPFYQNWDEAIFNDFIKKFNLPLNKVIGEMSRGMVTKGALAIAFSHHADFIIMDEPTASLDPSSRRELLDLLRELMQHEKRSILFSSHITTDIEQIADYVTFLKEGKLVFTKTKDELSESYALIKGGNDLLNTGIENHFIGIRKNEFGFEALTNEIDPIRKKYNNSVVIDPANLEDIIYFSTLKDLK